MNLAKLLRNPRFNWEMKSAPDPAALEAFRKSAPRNLPNTYVKLMARCDGGSGAVPYESGRIELWTVEDALRENQAHGVGASLPGYFAFGSDGNERLFAFDLREPDGAAVVSMGAKSPAPESVEVLAGSFSEFLEHAVNMGRAF